MYHFVVKIDLKSNCNEMKMQCEQITRCQEKRAYLNRFKL